MNPHRYVFIINLELDTCKREFEIKELYVTGKEVELLRQRCDCVSRAAHGCELSVIFSIIHVTNSWKFLYEKNSYYFSEDDEHNPKDNFFECPNEIYYKQYRTKKRGVQ